MKEIQFIWKKVFLLTSVSAALALTGCGGGNDDEPEPSGDIGILIISNATDSSLNGWYGSGNVGLTGVEDTGKIGPDECAFNFDNFSKLLDDKTLAMAGDIRYAYSNGSSSPPLNGDHIKINGITYDFVKEGDNLAKSGVNLTAGTISFDSLLARDKNSNSVELSGIIKLPDEKSRDAACNKGAG